MGRTYGESWAFFHANANASTQNNTRPITAELPISSQNPQAVRNTQPQLIQDTVQSDVAIIAQIRVLQQELDERRRSSQYGAPLEQRIHNPQQLSTSSAPTNPPTSISDPNSSVLPRCWDSCCNGRTFSNRSNFARHQREKLRGKDAADLKCSFCGVGFTRATARHAHEAERRCRNGGGNASAAG